MDSLKYIEASCKIFFQPGHMCCKFCPMMGEYPREHCNRTGEYLLNPAVTVGLFCPLELDSEPFEIGEETT